MTTVWKTAGKQLTVNGTPIKVKGVDYSPIPIGGAFDWTPFGDFTTDYWSPIFSTDLPRLREMNANALRTYSFWAWEPTTPNYQAALSGTLQSQRTVSHQKFLDACWNNGEHPIFVLIGVGWRPSDMPLTHTPGMREFYKQNLEKLAELYGSHPAVMGFCIGNEVDTAGAGGTLNMPIYYEIMNEYGRAVKEKAPDKLTTTALHDFPECISATGEGKFPAYDVMGLNCYRGPNGNPAQDLRSKGVNVPVLYTEWGAPYSTHTLSNDGRLLSGEAIELPPNLHDKHAEYVRRVWNEQLATDDFAGGFFFAWTDEYWKAGAPVYVHKANAGSVALDANGTPVPFPDSKDKKVGSGSFNGSFPGYFGDEEWFGINAISVSGGRDPKNPTVNGQPADTDQRHPRGTFAVLQEAFAK